MKPSSLFASLLLLTFCLVVASCTSSRKAETGASLPPIIQAGESSQKYNMQLDFMKHHFSGLLIVRRLPGDEIRILASTYFGLSLFDFSLRGKEFHVNSCIEPMRKQKMLQLLEADFKSLLLSTKDIRIKERSSTFEQRIAGRGFGKSVFSLSGFVSGCPEEIRIKHPWLRLSIQLNKLQDKTNKSNK